MCKNHRILTEEKKNQTNRFTAGFAPGFVLSCFGTSAYLSVLYSVKFETARE